MNDKNQWFFPQNQFVQNTLQWNIIFTWKEMKSTMVRLGTSKIFFKIEKEKRTPQNICQKWHLSCGCGDEVKDDPGLPNIWQMPWFFIPWIFFPSLGISVAMWWWGNRWPPWPPWQPLCLPSWVNCFRYFSPYSPLSTNQIIETRFQFAPILILEELATF